MRVILLSVFFISGCVTRGVNGPCGFIGPNGAYIPCSVGGMPTRTKKYYQGQGQGQGYQGHWSSRMPRRQWPSQRSR